VEPNSGLSEAWHKLVREKQLEWHESEERREMQFDTYFGHGAYRKMKASMEPYTRIKYNANAHPHIPTGATGVFIKTVNIYGELAWLTRPDKFWPGLADPYVAIIPGRCVPDNQLELNLEE